MSDYLFMYLLGTAATASGLLARRIGEPLSGFRVFADAAIPTGIMIVALTAFFQFTRY